MAEATPFLDLGDEQEEAAAESTLVAANDDGV